MQWWSHWCLFCEREEEDDYFLSFTICEQERVRKRIFFSFSFVRDKGSPWISEEEIKF